MSVSSEPSRIILKEHSAEEVHRLLASCGVDARLARRLQAAIIKHGASEIPERMPDASRRVLARVREVASVPSLRVLEKATSPTDGFTKYLFEGEGAEPFEAVRIPLMHRPHDRKYIVCVSSQVGCALGCVFCATGRMGFKRNLETWEIVDQIMRVQADSDFPVRGVVFMGMGEPMLNYDRVMKAAEILSEPCGGAIDAKAITISTVGIVPMIRRFTAERRPYRLVISLTSANSETRRALLPIENRYPLPELMSAVRDYQRATGKRVTLAWTALSGVNTRAEDARQLAELTAGMRMRLDLIDVMDASGQYEPPDTAELDAFRDALRLELGMPVARRYSGGRDIHGGCGMLAGKRVGASDPSPG